MKLTIKFNKKKPIKETCIITKIRAGALSHFRIMLKGAKDYYFFYQVLKIMSSIGSNKKSMIQLL